MELDALFIRLHEPGIRTFDSYLDEGQLTLRLPPLDSLTFAATLWQNRIIDMYTTLAGVELNRSFGQYAIEGGLYGGSASRYDLSGRFLGARIALTAEFGNLELT